VKTLIAFIHYLGEIVMTNKQIQYGVVAVTAVLLLLIAFSLFSGNSVNLISSNESLQLSSKQVQRSVNRSFPLSHTSNRIKIKLKNPKVILKEGWEHVAIDLDLNMAVKKRRANRTVFQPVYKGKITLSGVIDYSPTSKNITLSNIKLRILNTKNIKSSDIAKLEKSLVPILQTKLNKYPIYKLKGKQFNGELNKMTLSSVEINKKNINLELASN
jgi:hypothetical protein